MKYFVIVAGGGETSRANLEALMEDHYYANGADGVLVLPVTDKISAAQVFAAQYAKDKNKEIVIFSKDTSDFPGVPPATIHQSDNPIVESSTKFAGEKVDAFLLWSDEDSLSQTLLSTYSTAGIPCFDLTDGLSPISAVVGLKPAQETLFPIQEQDIPKPAEDEEDEDEEEEEEDDEEYEESEEDDEVYFAVQSLIQALARAVAAELRKGPQE